MNTQSKTTQKLSENQKRRALALAAFSASPTEQAHETVWRAFQPLVEFAARRFLKGGEDMALLAELIDAGNVGLLDALAEYMPLAASQGAEYELARFNALAMPLIRAAMARSVAVQRINADKHGKRLELGEKLNLEREAELVLPELEFLNAVLAFVSKARVTR